jgi:hypothetical protein
MTSSTNKNVLDRKPPDSLDDEVHHEGMVQETSPVAAPVCCCRIPAYHMVSTLILRSEACVVVAIAVLLLAAL